MGWLKSELIAKAFSQIGLDYTFDEQPEQIQDAGSTLDSMMAAWDDEGIRLGYRSDSTALVDVTADSGLPDTANMAVWSNLAMILASGLGRQVSQTLMSTAKRSYNTLLAKAAVAQPVRLSGRTPIGAGHKGWRGWDRVFIAPPPLNIDTGDGDGPLEFNAGGGPCNKDEGGT